MSKLNSELEYDKAINRIDSLMSAESDTPESDELMLWVHLVEEYEDEHYPIPPPDTIQTKGVNDA